MKVGFGVSLTSSSNCVSVVTVTVIAGLPDTGAVDVRDNRAVEGVRQGVQVLYDGEQKDGAFARRNNRRRS